MDPTDGVPPSAPPPVMDGPVGKEFKIDLIDPVDAIDEKYLKRVEA